MSAPVESPKEYHIPTDRMFLAHRQIQEANDEIESIERTLSDPAAKVQNRPGMNLQLRKLRDDLERQAAPPTTPDQRTQLAKRQKELIEELQPKMLSAEEMRKSPDGALGRNIRYEVDFKHKAIALKNILRAMNPGDDDPDLSNLEKFRPKTSDLGMHSAQIPGTTHSLPPDARSAAGQAYRDSIDRHAANKEADRMAALEARLDELLNQVAAKPGKKTKSQSYKRELVAAACGKMLKGNAGRATHERGCIKPECVAARAA